MPAPRRASPAGAHHRPRWLRPLCGAPTPGGSCYLTDLHPGSCLPLPPPTTPCPLHTPDLLEDFDA